MYSDIEYGDYEDKNLVGYIKIKYAIDYFGNQDVRMFSCSGLGLAMTESWDHLNRHSQFDNHNSH